MHLLLIKDKMATQKVPMHTRNLLPRLEQSLHLFCRKKIQMITFHTHEKIYVEVPSIAKLQAGIMQKYCKGEYKHHSSHYQSVMTSKAQQPSSWVNSPCSPLASTPH